MDLKLYGGAPALDLANSIDPMFGPERHDHLDSPEALAAWMRDAGLPPIEADAGTYRRALALRAAIDAIFRAASQGQEPPPDALGVLADAHRDALASARLVPAEAGYRWESADPLWPIVSSALDLLSTSLEQVRLCESHDCGWLFLDTSRNGRRRWCSMQGCGSREKMRRYRARGR